MNENTRISENIVDDLNNKFSETADRDFILYLSCLEQDDDILNQQENEPHEADEQTAPFALHIFQSGSKAALVTLLENYFKQRPDMLSPFFHACLNQVDHLLDADTIFKIRSAASVYFLQKSNLAKMLTGFFKKHPNIATIRDDGTIEFTNGETFNPNTVSEQIKEKLGETFKRFSDGEQNNSNNYSL